MAARHQLTEKGKDDAFLDSSSLSLRSLLGGFSVVSYASGCGSDN